MFKQILISLLVIIVCYLLIKKMIVVFFCKLNLSKLIIKYPLNDSDKSVLDMYSADYKLTDLSGKSFQLQYELEDFNTLRTLINRENRKGPEFYSNKDTLLPIANAENVMYEYSKAKLEHDIGSFTFNQK